jgi:hypothetical protein
VCPERTTFAAAAFISKWIAWWSTFLVKLVGVWGFVSAVNSEGRIIWIADASRGDRKGFVVYVDETLMAFLELEATIRRPG